MPLGSMLLLESNQSRSEFGQQEARSYGPGLLFVNHLWFRPGFEALEVRFG